MEGYFCNLRHCASQIFEENLKFYNLTEAAGTGCIKGPVSLETGRAGHLMGAPNYLGLTGAFTSILHLGRFI